ncbi:MAG: NifB/NifX family molybdenum-iron cluster-binding protein [Candidatus Nanoarchaeia archaeon]|nr:NifB/NifX family molybdenum-iron cluster-binding protein [Candidatus Nanoarchaeia archaeon]
MRKIGVTSTGQGIDSMASMGFGQSPYFCIVEWDNGQITGYKAIANNWLNANCSAACTKQLAAEGIESIVTGFIGNNSYNALKANNIEVYALQSAGKVEDIAKDYFAGNLPPMNGPNSPGRGTGRGQGSGMGQGKGRGQGNGRGQGKGQGRGRNRP